MIECILFEVGGYFLLQVLKKSEDIGFSYSIVRNFKKKLSKYSVYKIDHLDIKNPNFSPVWYRIYCNTDDEFFY